MQIEHLSRLKAWFKRYTRSFLTGDAVSDAPLVLKIDHTDRVCNNICMLGRSIDLSEPRLCIAETVGLLHDVGRFEQYRCHGTFNDHQSVNHAALGINVLKKNSVLDCLAADTRRVILDAVRFHNAPCLPTGRPQTATLFMGLIRDADKLDIWKVFADFYRSDQPPEPAIVQHLTDHPVWEKTIIDAILQRRVARFQDMKSLNDFKLLQLSWVFDLNFSATCALARQRGDLAAIAQTLPDAPDVQRAITAVMARLNHPTNTGHR